MEAAAPARRPLGAFKEDRPWDHTASDVLETRSRPPPGTPPSRGESWSPPAARRCVLRPVAQAPAGVGGSLRRPREAGRPRQASPGTVLGSPRPRGYTGARHGMRHRTSVCPGLEGRPPRGLSPQQARPRRGPCWQPCAPGLPNLGSAERRPGPPPARCQSAGRPPSRDSQTRPQMRPLADDSARSQSAVDASGRPPSPVGPTGAWQHLPPLPRERTGERGRPLSPTPRRRPPAFVGGPGSVPLCATGSRTPLKRSGTQPWKRNPGSHLAGSSAPGATGPGFPGDPLCHRHRSVFLSPDGCNGNEPFPLLECVCVCNSQTERGGDSL